MLNGKYFNNFDEFYVYLKLKDLEGDLWKQQKKKY
jgi:hypothetical protein